MSLVKLAWSSQDAANAAQDDLKKLKGGILGSRGSQAASTHKEHLKNVNELKAAKDAHANAPKVLQSDALARVQKAQQNVQNSASSLRNIVNPTGVNATPLKKVVATPLAHGSAPAAAGEGLLSKVKGFVSANPGKSLAIGSALAAGGYLAHKMSQNKQNNGY